MIDPFEVDLGVRFGVLESVIQSSVVSLSDLASFVANASVETDVPLNVVNVQ